MLTREKILKAPKKNYMNKDQLVFFQSLLNDLKQETLTHIREAKDRLSNPPSCSDEVDRAQHEIDSMLFLRIVERESKLLPKIDKAIMRIKAGDYGFCLETGEPIGLERLISRPTAEYCAEVKTINEEKEKHFVD
jgi:DnaK suppressor protein